MASSMNFKRNDNPQDRTAYLQELLKYPLTKDDLVPCVRETARLLIAIDKDIATLPALVESVTNLEKLFLEFMGKQLEERQERVLRERAAADALLTDTQKKLRAVQQARATLEEHGVLQVPVHEERMNWKVWIREKILPNQINILVAAIILFVINALMDGLVSLLVEAVKAQLN